MSFKKGFSLIELLLVIGLTIIFLISSFFIYQKVSLNNTVKSISNDMSYSITEYKRALIYPSEYFSNKSGCCDMSPAIHSNFKLFKTNPNNSLAQKYYSFNGYSITISSYENFHSDKSGSFSDNSYLSYQVDTNKNTELCTQIIMDNLHKFSYVFLNGYYSKNGGTIQGKLTTKANLKKISTNCANSKSFSFYYFSIN